jgi:hypothetical protein
MLLLGGGLSGRGEKRFYKRSYPKRRMEEHQSKTPIDDTCPNCRSSAHLVWYYSLTISFGQWETILGVFVLFCFSGYLLNSGFWPSIGFAGLGVIPFITQFNKRTICEACGIQFGRTLSKEKNNSL